MILFYMFMKTMPHGMTEKAEFHKNNIDYLVETYLSTICNRKEIYAVTETEQILLIVQNENELPRNAMLLDDSEDKDLWIECQRAAGTVLQQLLLKNALIQKENMEKMLEKAGSWMEQKQRFSYVKEIKKKQGCCKKVFKDKRMEGYDFREINLADSIFINCSLVGANFSYVNLENAIFINCDLEDAVFYKAQTANAGVIQGTYKYIKQIGDWTDEKEKIFYSAKK